MLTWTLGRHPWCWGATTAWPPGRSLRPLGVGWVDARADMNTPSTSTSGNVHGMSLAALSGPEPAELASIGDVIPTIRPLNAPQKALGRDSGVHLFTMSDIDRLALATVTQRTLSLIGRGRADLHLSFDLDMCDPAIAPGVPPPCGAA